MIAEGLDESSFTDRFGIETQPDGQLLMGVLRRREQLLDFIGGKPHPLSITLTVIFQLDRQRQNRDEEAAVRRLPSQRRRAMGEVSRPLPV